MTDFAVWAPLPKLVRLDVDGTVHDMTAGDDGWWRAGVDCAADARYGFLLDDDPAKQGARIAGLVEAGPKRLLIEPLGLSFGDDALQLR